MPALTPPCDWQGATRRLTMLPHLFAGQALFEVLGRLRGVATAETLYERWRRITCDIVSRV